MTFDAQEKAPIGRPVEMYEFTQSGVFTRYTSAATSQFIGANEFPPLPGLSRSEPVQGNEITSGEVQVTMPSSELIPQQFRGTIPSSLPLLTIFRKHLNDVADEQVAWFKGTVVSCAFREGVATLACQPPTRLFSRTVPRAVYSGLCNNQLYDTQCGVVKTDYDFPLAVVSAIVEGITLTITGLRAQAAVIDTAFSLGLTAQELDDFWLRGYIGTDATPAEFRMVAESDVGGDPDTVRIIHPFRSLAALDTVTVFAGCPHDIDFCNRKFQNADRFGGFPQVPTNNPFQIELDSGINEGDARRPSLFSGVLRE